MQIARSALKHGVTEGDALHVFRNAIRVVQYDYQGEDRLLYIGADTSGRMLEVVAVPMGEPSRIIHADILRPKFHDYLR